MPEWQKKLSALCDGLGPVGDAVFREIADSIQAEIDAAFQRGADAEKENCICRDYPD